MTGKKIEIIRDKKYKNLKIQQNNLSLLRRKHGVAHEEESDKEIES